MRERERESFLSLPLASEKKEKEEKVDAAACEKLEGRMSPLLFLSRAPLLLSFQKEHPQFDSPVRVLAARDLLAVEQHVRDRVEPRDDEVDGGLREGRRGIDIKGALKGPDLLGDVAVLALVEAV